jgi:multidrug efflux pump subunit AcrB
MINWFTRNGIAANLLMLTIIGCGLAAMFNRIPLEVFPYIALDNIYVRMSYRGATPSEVEEGVAIRIEEAIFDLEGIKHLYTECDEGRALIRIELENGYQVRNILDDVKNRVDAITTFPTETERPTYSTIGRRRETISVVLAGDLEEHALRRLGEEVRDDIASLPGITQVELKGVRAYEIALEISEQTLRAYGMTFDEVVRAVRRSSLDVPAGSIKSAGGDILVRSKGQAYRQQDFEQIVLRSFKDGTHLTLGQVARIRDGFEETPIYARYNGTPAVEIEVHRIGDQNAIELADAVKAYVIAKREQLPEEIEVSWWRDSSKTIRGRLSTLIESALFGTVLIILLLSLTMRFSLACFVFLGIPVAFLGAFAVMPLVGVTINLISLFAFILVLGIVVDDAIVVGESIFSHLENGEDGTQAAIRGTHAVATPVTFGVLTTIAAFVPLALMPGERGQIFYNIPAVVIPVLLFSLVGSKLILPAHLKHLRPGRRKRAELNVVQRIQRCFSDGLVWFSEKVYRNLLDFCLANRYVALSVFLAVFMISIGIWVGGIIGFRFLPKVESERATASLVMPIGTPAEVTRQHIIRIEEAARRLQADHRVPGTSDSIIENMFSVSGGRGAANAANQGRVTFEIMAAEERDRKGITTTTRELTGKWREAIGQIPGAEELTFRAVIMQGGSPIDVQLEGFDFDELETLAEQVKERLHTYAGVYEINDNFQNKKEEIKLRIKPEAETLGLTMADLAGQVRQAFFGAEAQRVPRGREDIRVMIRYPESERQSVYDLENMMVRTQEGTEVPFSEVAEMDMGLGYSRIRRVDRKRTVAVLADYDESDIARVRDDLEVYLDELMAAHPRVQWSWGGEAEEEAETTAQLRISLLFTLFVIFAMMAIPFRSIIQPIIVMAVIPFGLVGAVLGHLIMGRDLSIMSVFGMLALAGVVVNDSLVMVDYVNRRRREGMPLREAVCTSGVARFRPILLTSLTTFFGLLPLIFETSTQAQFLIPMAVSLGFGILFATFITLLLVPINYMVLEDIKRGGRWLFGK